MEIGVGAELAARVRTHDAPPVGVLVPAGSLTGALAAVQALGDAGIAAPLWLLTRGAVATGSADPAVDPLRPVLGVRGRDVCLYHPDGRGGLIDLPVHLDVRAGG
ncbi:hypothetical protein, partial [Streptomyces sp. BE303]|uniref:hypothetical protein n=1 Tax=Streptomyces sp. BE303 TaxID=3002528 RepID=UPI002E760B72